MSKPVQVSFTSVIHTFDNMDAMYIPIEFDVEQTFGKKRLKVKVWFDDVLYRGSLARYDGRYFLLINKTIRAQLGKQAGDTVQVRILEDKDERKVELPPALADFLLQETAVKAAFDRLSFTHQKEYVDWLSSAKKESTVQNRLLKFKSMLLAAKK